MNNYKNVFELVDISSSEDEERLLERASTPLHRESIPNYRVVPETSYSSVEATADGEECFDISTDSLETNCKKMKLDYSLESLELESHNYEANSNKRRDEGLPDSPESPDESMSSDIFVVEEPPTGEESMTSDKVAEYLERVRKEDSSSYFNTLPGTPRRISFKPASPLNDLEEERNSSTTSETSMELPPLTFVPRQPGRGAFPRGVALSQPAPGLGCSCKRVGIGRGHGCSLRFPRWYFNY